MKICILTLDGYMNYGNVLQRYAMRKVLLGYGTIVDSIWHDKDNFLPLVWWQWGVKEVVKFFLNWYGYRRNIFSNLHGMEMVRQGKIKEWCDRYIGIKPVLSDLRSLSEKYDCFVVGSDQVWNPANNDIRDLFLSFASSKKRIAYAASVSTPDIPQKKLALFKEGLAGMAHISVREKEGADLVKKLTNLDVPVLVDPTLLLTPESWSKVSRQPAWYHGGDYILTYFLGERPNVVSRLERETGLPVVNLLDENVYEHYVTGPDEFLWAIEHAKLMYTDSFHGTVFSILFRIPFVVCNRVGDSVTEKMGSRIDTLLGYFGLENRRGTKANGYAIENPLAEPDWSKVDGVLATERQRSADYLQMALKKER